MRLMASNMTNTHEEVAAHFTFGSAMSLNFTFDNFVIYKSFGETTAMNAVLQASTVDFGTQDWNQVLTDFCNTITENANEQYAGGKDLKKN